MTEGKVSKLYARLAIQFDAMLATLLAKNLISEEIIRSYMRDNWSVKRIPLTELAKKYSADSPRYVIQSWMRSHNTLEFLRQWEFDMNAEFDDVACEELIWKAHSTSLTITPSLWIRETYAVGMFVKQGKGGGVRPCPEIAADFRLWLDPKTRLAIVRYCHGKENWDCLA